MKSETLWSNFHANISTTNGLINTGSSALGSELMKHFDSITTTLAPRVDMTIGFGEICMKFAAQSFWFHCKWRCCEPKCLGLEPLFDLYPCGVSSLTGITGRCIHLASEFLSSDFWFSDRQTDRRQCLWAQNNLLLFEGRRLTFFPPWLAGRFDRESNKCQFLSPPIRHPICTTWHWPSVCEISTKPLLQ